MRYLIAVVLIILAFGIFGVRIYKGVIFKQNVTGHLKRAGDANTIDLAKSELKVVIDYLEANNLTSGYTSILWKTPEEDVEFWYKNVKASLLELENLNSDSPLEKTNVLIKLRETLLDTGEKIKVTVPKSMSVFPHNKLWAALMTIAFSSLFVAIGILSTNGKNETLKRTSEE